MNHNTCKFEGCKRQFWTRDKNRKFCLKHNEEMSHKLKYRAEPKYKKTKFVKSTEDTKVQAKKGKRK